MVILLLSAAPALAGPIIDFSGSSGGTVSFLTGGCATDDMCGVNISIETVAGNDTPQNAGLYNIWQGSLNFTTGSLVSFSNGLYTFGAGEANSFTITGRVPSALGWANTTLVTGRLLSMTVNTTSPTGIYLLTASGSGIMNEALAAYFGFTGTSFDLSQATIHITLAPTAGLALDGVAPAFGGSAFSIGIPYAPTPVPEPGTFALLGSGLLGLATWARGRFQRP
jgi:PEP-CTERM motif-containing protein